MPLILTDKTIQGLRGQAVQAIYDDGIDLIDERGEEIKELYDMMLVLKGVGCDISPDPIIARLDRDFAEGLILDWKAWEKAVRFDYSYGARMREKDMLKKAIGHFRTSKYTRRNWIPIFHPDDVGSSLEVPCCIGMDLKIRPVYGYDRLFMTTVFRSNEMNIAAQSDIYGYRMLQKYLAHELRVGIGDYVQMSISAHLRYSDWDSIETLVKKRQQITGAVSPAIMATA